MIIEAYSYPRAAVIGNPSDGYFGKTIAFVFKSLFRLISNKLGLGKKGKKEITGDAENLEAA